MNQIDIELYKTFSKKELVEGCKVVIQSTGGVKKIATLLEHYDAGYSRYYSKGTVMSVNNTNRRFKASWSIIEILGHIPHLEDVFQKAKENNKDIELYQYEKGGYYLATNVRVQQIYIDYNPCESLLNQTDETKQKLLKLFK